MVGKVLGEIERYGDRDREMGKSVKKNLKKNILGRASLDYNELET